MFHHQASLSTRDPEQIFINEFPKQCVSKEFAREIFQSSYMLEDNFTEARLCVEIFGSDVSMRKAFERNLVSRVSLLPPLPPSWSGQMRDPSKEV